MPFYSDELIEEVRSKNDIVDVISGYVRLERHGNTYFGLCPFHGEKTPSFSVTPSKDMFYCFGCHAGGNVITFVQKYENVSFPEAVKILAERVGVELPQYEMSDAQRLQASKKNSVLEINKEAARYFYTLLRNPRGKHAYDYFAGRGLSDETMQKFGLGYADQYSDDLYRYLKQKGYSDELLKESGLIVYDEVRGGHDKFWNRVMFPIMDVNNRVIAFGGRVMGDGKPKYMNSPETIIFNKRRNLYGLNIAKSTRKDYLILCEGNVDVISLHQAGFDNVVAPLGTALTEEQISLMKRYKFNKVYLSFDSDSAGIDATLRAIDLFKKADIMTKVINMNPKGSPDKMDPDEFIKTKGAEAYQQLIDQAENGFLYKVRMEERDFDLKDPSGKSAFFNSVATMLTDFSEELERNTYIQAVAEQYMIGYEELRKLVNSTALKGGIVKPQVKLKSGINEKNKKEDGMKRSQKLMLTWLIEDTRLFGKIQGIITPADFTEELYGKVAGILFSQFEESGKVNPASIISLFDDEEEQQEVAGLFNARIHEVDSKNDREKALKETIIRIKQNSVDYRSKTLDPNDMEGFMKIVEDKRNLEKLEKLHISID